VTPSDPGDRRGSWGVVTRSGVEARTERPAGSQSCVDSDEDRSGERVRPVCSPRHGSTVPTMEGQRWRRRDGLPFGTGPLLPGVWLHPTWQGASRPLFFKLYPNPVKPCPRPPATSVDSMGRGSLNGPDPSLAGRRRAWACAGGWLWTEPDPPAGAGLAWLGAGPATWPRAARVPSPGCRRVESMPKGQWARPGPSCLESGRG
jgi:hypothetical protein